MVRVSAQKLLRVTIAVNYQSFTNMVMFMVTNGERMMPREKPGFRISHDGFVDVFWENEKFQSAMIFLPSGRVSFFASASDDGTHVSGTTGMTEVTSYLHMFWIHHLTFVDKMPRWRPKQ